MKIREQETVKLGPVSVSFDGLHITASFGSSYGKVWVSLQFRTIAKTDQEDGKIHNLTTFKQTFKRPTIEV